MRAASYRSSGNVLQRRQQDDHVVAEVLPHGEDHDRRHRPARIAHPVDRVDPDRGERVVQEAVARVEDVAPHDRDRDQRRDHRREVHRAEHAAELRDLRIHEQRCAERRADRQRHAERDEVQRVAERFPEQRLAQQPRVVLEADPAQIAEIVRARTDRSRSGSSPSAASTGRKKNTPITISAGATNHQAARCVRFEACFRALHGEKSPRRFASCVRSLSIIQRRFSRISSVLRSSATHA